MKLPVICRLFALPLPRRSSKVIRVDVLGDGKLLFRIG
jgi:hypothetical protein